MSAENVRKSNFTKLRNYLSQVNAHSTTPLSLVEAETLLTRVKEVMTKCEEAHEKLLAACVDDAAVTVQDSAFSPIEATAMELRWKLQAIIRNHPDAAAPSGGASAPLSVKLPTLEPISFDGNPANWLSFRDLFLGTIDNNNQLKPSMKLQYLKSYVTGEPAKLIRDILVTDSNYKIAWDLLDDRYNNEREIITALVAKLLFPTAITKESATQLQQLLDRTNECLRSLKVLKQPTDTWDTLIVVLLTSKLDPTTRREWAIRQSSTTLPTFQEFSTFLNNHIRGLLATGASQTQSKSYSKNGRSVGTHHTSTSNNIPQCSICEGAHPHYKCKDFNALSPKERSSLAAKHHLCFNCLVKGHGSRACESTSRCKKCKSKHHTLLHEDRQPKREDPPARGGTGGDQGRDPPPPNSLATPISSHHTETECHVLLATAVVLVEDSSGEPVPCRAVLDNCSQASFITEDCAARIGLRRFRSNLSLSGIATASGGTTKGKVFATVGSVQHSTSIPMELHILTQVTKDLPSMKINNRTWPHLRGIILADPKFYEPQRVDILIGADYYNHVLRDGKRIGPLDSPSALETVFGWVLSGRVPIATYHVEVHHGPTEFDIIRRFWEVEEPPKTVILTKEEKQCEVHYLANFTRDATGRFTVRIPFNEKKTALGGSKSTAIRRFEQVERRLQRQPQHQKSYQEFMTEYAAMGHMQLIPEGEREEVIGKTFYLPHHFVTNESSSTTKLRVVFDGSARTTTGVSLNEAIQVGPTIQEDLYVILLRFRLHAIVLKADIAKMFRQFYLPKEDADFHRIVWRESPDQPLREYRLTTVTYGTACAPYLSTRCLYQLAQDSKVEYPVAAHSIQHDVYVDDVMTGANAVSTAMQLYQDLSKVMSTACLELRKWSSNNPEVLQGIPEELRETSPHSFDDDPVIKALGVRWHPTSDYFIFHYIPPTEYSGSKTLTKRILSSDLARVFDPLGLVSPVVVRAKLLLQDLWRSSVGWDDPVPIEIQQQWESYQDDMKNIESLRFPRRITTDDTTTYEIHGFSDASEKAYGAVLYLRSICNDGNIYTSLVTSKTKVSPLRQVTLPRLELMGAVLLAELVSEVQTHLNLDCNVFLWTDSTITLNWISSQPRRWKTFVANRVAKIQECTQPECWRFVPGVENPADLCSRGSSVSDLAASSFWLNGPDWLLTTQNFKPPNVILLKENLNFFSPDDLEERGVPTSSLISTHDLSIMEKFSSLLRLNRVTAHLRRFIFNASHPNNKQPGSLSPQELHDALQVWIRQVQQQVYAEEFASLRSRGQVQPKSKLRTLHPYIDSSGILRLSGRLHNAAISEDRKHLIIIPVSSHLAELIIANAHKNTLHGGFQLTWSTIHQQFWIPAGRNKVRYYVRSCVKCIRYRCQTAEQLMGSLPSSRVNPSRPFTHTGVDYAGPFTLKNAVGRAPKTYKGYLCLFVCMATKALHLEAVSSMTTDGFLAAFRRFTSRRGYCSHVYSDNGKNFVGADKELKLILATLKDDTHLADQISSLGITWHWSPPSGPHHGGIFEAGVKSAKHHLRRVMGDTYLTYEQFSTLLCQVEAILNSRPLHPLSSDPTDVTALTPGHFLIGEPLLAVPDTNLTEIPTNRLNLYQQQQHRIQQFWRRWSQDYLNTLQQRNKWWWEKENLAVGDLVILKEDSPPSTWPLARIIAVHTNEKDGKVRRVTIKTPSTTLERPIVKLIPLINNDK